MKFKRTTQATSEKETRIIRKMRNIRTTSTLLRYTIQAACIIILFTFGLQNTIVASGSMEPTLMTGEMVLYNRLAYVFREVQRGDIIVFWCDDPLCIIEQNIPRATLAKRVIAIGGDTIEFRDHQVYINGCLLDESAYLPDYEYTEPNKYTGCHKYTVPENCVFVMGDARTNSYDSRYFDNPFISEDNIIGKYLGTIPYVNISQLKNFFNTKGRNLRPFRFLLTI